MKRHYSLTHWLDFTLALTARELKGRYKHVALGFLWIMINPLLQMLVIGLVFQFFPILRTENYFLYLFLGLLPWNFFATSFTTGVPLFVHERHLIKKAAFPREALIISLAASNFVHFLIGLAVALPFAQTVLRLDWLLAGAGWLLVFVIGLMLLFATLNVRFRDIDFLAKAIVPIWFYATPIIYSADLLPSFLRQWLAVNPVTPIIGLFRAGFGLQAAPDVSSLLWPLCLTGAIIAAGVLTFRREAKYFDDWM